MTNYNDVSKLAKVSSSTVSHVINKTRFVDPETRKRVLSAIRKLNYHPNLLARSLATGRTYTIGLIISDLRNPFFIEIVHGVEELSIKIKYNIFLCTTDYNIDKGKETIKALINKKVDGIIIASCLSDNIFFIEDLIRTNIPVVIVDWNKTDLKTDSIIFDFKPGIKEGLDYLISLGHKKIYFISGPKSLNTSVIRSAIFESCIKKHYDLKINYKILEGDFKINGGRKAVSNLIEKEDFPTAIMCANDLTAIGVIDILKSHNIVVPEDISVIGLDNIELTELVTPKLTTLEYKMYTIGKAAMKLLMNRIKFKSIPIQREKFKTKLIIRESVAEAKKSHFY
jgi:LacI family transcriptional regulator